jgi:hypothetical protein
VSSLNHSVLFVDAQSGVDIGCEKSPMDGCCGPCLTLSRLGVGLHAVSGGRASHLDLVSTPTLCRVKCAICLVQQRLADGVRVCAE